MKRVMAFFIFVLAVAACGGNAGDRLLGSSETVSATPTPPSLQQIQVNQTRVLPPFGLKVKADVAALKVRVSSSEKETATRLETIREATEQISALAANSDSVDLQSVSVNWVSSGSKRDSTISSYLGDSFDSSSAIVTLTTDLADQNDNLLDSLIVFNDFLHSLNLPESISFDTLSVEAQISDPDIYRAQLIAQVYQELAAIQEEYGRAVKFEITGLHSGLQTIPLSDTDYHLYLEPAIIVNEF